MYADIVRELSDEVDHARQQQQDACFAHDASSVYQWNAGYIKGLMFALTALTERLVLDLRDVPSHSA